MWVNVPKKRTDNSIKLHKQYTCKQLPSYPTARGFRAYYALTGDRLPVPPLYFSFTFPGLCSAQSSPREIFCSRSLSFRLHLFLRQRKTFVQWFKYFQKISLPTLPAGIEKKNFLLLQSKQLKASVLANNYLYRVWQLLYYVPCVFHHLCFAHKSLGVCIAFGSRILMVPVVGCAFAAYASGQFIDSLPAFFKNSVFE